MKVYSAYQDGRLTIFLQGELDHHEIKSSISGIESLIEQYMPRMCILDLRSLSFMDSSGIALILRLSRQLSLQGGKAWVENATGQPLRVIDASGIERLVRIAAEREGAV